MNPSIARVTVPAIIESKSERKLSALTAYDFTFAKLIDAGGIDIILVGDSLGSVIQGHDTPLPVTLDQVIYHCCCVTKGVARALVVGDMPFMSYQVSTEQACHAAGRLVKEGGVGAVKLEGGIHVAKTIEHLVNMEIPVMGHIGLTPQAYHRMGGFRVQGRSHSNGQTDKPGSWERVIADARAVEAAGAFSVVLEGIPEELSAILTAELSIPTIGIGAGKSCDGQILVSYDLLGLNPEFSPPFVRRYAELGKVITAARKDYVVEIEHGSFPGDAETFRMPKEVGLKVAAA